MAVKTFNLSDPAVAQGFAAARAVCRRDSDDWFLATLFLPRRKQQALYAALALCRMIAEAFASQCEGAAAMRHQSVVGQSCCGADANEWKLQLLRERIDAIYDGQMELPAVQSRSPSQHVLQAFSHTVQQHEIPRELFLEFATGCKARSEVRRYATWQSLAVHFTQQGGSVARIVGSILGVTHSEAHRALVQLALAVQLTWLLRDVSADTSRGRIAIPLADMSRCRYSERDFLARNSTQAWVELISFEADRARELYRAGAEAICWLAGDGSRLAASVLLVQSMALLDRLEKQAHKLLSHSPRLKLADKVRCLHVAWRLALRDAGEPMPKIFHRCRR